MLVAIDVRLEYFSSAANLVAITRVCCEWVGALHHLVSPLAVGLGLLPPLHDTCVEYQHYYFQPFS